MKIKNWLLLTYFIIMILPIVSIYGLYVWVNSYYQSENVAEYIDKWTELHDMKNALMHSNVFEKGANYQRLEELSDEQTGITLYSKSGLILYSSNPLAKPVSSFIDRADLYHNLFEFQQNYNAFTYKEPVWIKGNLVGIYEITLIRSEWVEGVQQRSIIVLVGAMGIFLLIYSAFVWLVNRKLNQPLEQLMRQMDAFAKGEQSVASTPKRKDELGELAMSFYTMQREVEEGKRALAEEQKRKELMIASISHDLKTPLTSIQAYAEALQNDALSKRTAQEYRDIIIAKSDYMKQMLADLTMYALLQSSDYDQQLTEVEGAEFFEMLLSDYSTPCYEKGFILHETIEVNGQFAVHPKQLMRVADNLIVNAWNHTESGGEIGIAAVNAGTIPTWCFSFVKQALTQSTGMYLIVQNSGSGIEPKEIHRLFEPLYQADDARTKHGHQGTGLGLTITKDIIEKHGGTVEIVSRIGIGTAILCWLPKR